MEDIKRDIELYLFCITDPSSSNVSNKVCKGIYSKINKLKSVQKEQIIDCINETNKYNMKISKDLECSNIKNINQQEIYLYDYNDLILYKDPKQKNVTFCFTKDELQYLTDTNPYTKQKFSKDFLNHVKNIKSQHTKSLREVIEDEVEDIKYKEQQDRAEKIDAIDNILHKIDKYLSTGTYIELNEKFKSLIYDIADKELTKDEIINFLYNNKNREDLRSKMSYIYLIVKHAFLLGELDSENTSQEQREIYISQINDIEQSLLGSSTYGLEDAITKNKINKVERLLKNPRIDPAKDNQLAIRVASDLGHLEIVKMLLKDPRVDPSVMYQTALNNAAESGHLLVVRELLKDPRIDPSADDQAALFSAAESGQILVVKELLKDPRIDPSADDQLAIRHAAAGGHILVVKELLKDSIVDPSVNDQEPIRWATAGGHLNVVKRLLKDPRVDLTKAIKKAAKDGYLEVVEELMKHLKGKKKN